MQLRIKRILVFVLILAMYNCASSSRTMTDKTEIYKIVNLQLKRSGKSILYYRPLSNTTIPLSDSEGIFKCRLYNPDLQKAGHLKDSIGKLNLTSFHEQKLIDSIEKEYVHLRTREFLTEQEITNMSKKLKLKTSRWEKKLVSAQISKSKTIQLSVPVLNDKKDIALLYLKDEGYLVANFFRKNKEGWSLFCYYPQAFYD